MLKILLGKFGSHLKILHPCYYLISCSNEVQYQYSIYFIPPGRDTSKKVLYNIFYYFILFYFILSLCPELDKETHVSKSFAQ